ncbi:MAG: hypothetical protein ACLFSR_02810 [Halomonas sp.]
MAISAVVGRLRQCSRDGRHARRRLALFEKLIDSLEDLDDVQRVFHNAEPGE